MVCTGLVVLRSQEREHHVPSVLTCVCILNIDDVTHSKVGASMDHTMDMGSGEGADVNTEGGTVSPASTTTAAFGAAACAALVAATSL